MSGNNNEFDEEEEFDDEDSWNEVGEEFWFSPVYFKENKTTCFTGWVTIQIFNF